MQLPTLSLVQGLPHIWATLVLRNRVVVLFRLKRLTQPATLTGCVEGRTDGSSEHVEIGAYHVFRACIIRFPFVRR